MLTGVNLSKYFVLEITISINKILTIVPFSGSCKKNQAFKLKYISQLRPNNIKRMLFMK